MNQIQYLDLLSAAGCQDALVVAEELLAWLPNSLAPVSWTEGAGEVQTLVEGEPRMLFSFRCSGELGLNFKKLLKGKHGQCADCEFIEELRRRLDQLPGRLFRDAKLANWPRKYDLRELSNPSAIGHFKETWQWIVGRVGPTPTFVLRLSNKRARLHFRNEFRQAREAALKDVEAFDQLLHVVERFGSYLCGGIHDLGTYGPYIAVAASSSRMARASPASWPTAHTDFDVLYKLVRDARNDAMHQGVFARHLTAHALELTIVLEDALMTNENQIRDFMVESPICACLWQPISFIRQTLLLNSFTYLPVKVASKDGSQWQLVSDRCLAQYLRRDLGKRERDARLMKSLGEAVAEKGVTLLRPRIFDASASVGDIFADVDHLPVLVTTTIPNPKTPTDDREELIGILTPFDVL